MKWIPRLESLRYRRVNVQKPRAPFYLRAKYEELVKPIYKEDSIFRTPPIKCMKNEELQRKTLEIVSKPNLF